MKKTNILVTIESALNNDARVQSFTAEHDAITGEIEKISVYFQQMCNDTQNVSKRFTVRNNRITCKVAYLEHCNADIVKTDARHSVFYIKTDAENCIAQMFDMFMTELASRNAIEIDNLHELTVVKKSRKRKSNAQ